ncbi:MAG TPA: TetR family transcriptional regulator [Solirubrobacteraceae bacterium]|jgi:AcrR family transcriptional regulator
MARWQPDALGRLQQAALTLYGERGFDNTTVAEIAESAGLTKRTFFRYFADKREVLFYGAEELEELFTSEVAAAPESATPLDAVAAALDVVAAGFEERRELAARRQQIIIANPELQERELIKLAKLARAVAGALRDRGVADPAAILTAEAAIAVFRVAFERWVDPANRKGFQRLIRESLKELRAVTAA